MEGNRRICKGHKHRNDSEKTGSHSEKKRTQTRDLGVFLLWQRQEGRGTWVRAQGRSLGRAWAELDLGQAAPCLKPQFPQGDNFYFEDNYNKVEVTCKETSPGDQNKLSCCPYFSLP